MSRRHVLARFADVLKSQIHPHFQDDDDVTATTATVSTRRTPKRANTSPKTAASVANNVVDVVASPTSLVSSLVTASLAAAINTPTSSGNKSTTNIADPRYRKPFQFGWKRELVYRAHNDVHRKQYDKAEVYYITPANKKLRTRADILINLTEGLDANDFTFAREPIGMSADEEIIRSAKLQAPSAKRPVNFLDLGEADPMLGFGKRVPKPKVPKGASPPPPGSSSSVASLMGKQGGRVCDDVNA